MAKMTLILSEPPHGRERAYLAMRFILVARNEGHDVIMVLFEDAVCKLRRGGGSVDMPADLQEKMTNCENLIKAAVDMGADVRICQTETSTGSLRQEDMVEGAVIGTMRDLVGWVAGADRVISF
jgi:tRNA 2-thiouridine synthesizing protein D